MWAKQAGYQLCAGDRKQTRVYKYLLLLLQLKLKMILSFWLMNRNHFLSHLKQCCLNRTKREKGCKLSAFKATSLLFSSFLCLHMRKSVVWASNKTGQRVHIQRDESVCTEDACGKWGLMKESGAPQRASPHESCWLTGCQWWNSNCSNDWSTWVCFSRAFSRASYWLDAGGFHAAGRHGHSDKKKYINRAFKYLGFLVFLSEYNSLLTYRVIFCHNLMFCYWAAERGLPSLLLYFTQDSCTNWVTVSG